MPYHLMLITLVFLSLASHRADAAVVLDFEDRASSPTFSGLSNVGNLYSNSGFTVAALQRPGVTSSPVFLVAGQASIVYAGSTALFTNSDYLTEIRRQDLGAFSLNSMDISEWNTDVSPRTITFTGTKADLSSVSQSVTLDGTFGFETFALTGFNDVVRVQWLQTTLSHQFDNVVLDASASPSAVVPEPSGWMTCLTLAMLGFVYRHYRLHRAAPPATEWFHWCRGNESRSLDTPSFLRLKLRCQHART